MLTFAKGVLAQSDLAVDGAHRKGTTGALHGLGDGGAPALDAADLNKTCKRGKKNTRNKR